MDCDRNFVCHDGAALLYRRQAHGATEASGSANGLSQTLSKASPLRFMGKSVLCCSPLLSFVVGFSSSSGSPPHLIAADGGLE